MTLGVNNVMTLSVNNVMTSSVQKVVTHNTGYVEHRYQLRGLAVPTTPNRHNHAFIAFILAEPKHIQLLIICSARPDSLDSPSDTTEDTGQE